MTRIAEFVTPTPAGMVVDYEVDTEVMGKLLRRDDRPSEIFGHTETICLLVPGSDRTPGVLSGILGTIARIETNDMLREEELSDEDQDEELSEELDFQARERAQALSARIAASLRLTQYMRVPEIEAAAMSGFGTTNLLLQLAVAALKNGLAVHIDNPCSESERQATYAVIAMIQGLEEAENLAAHYGDTRNFPEEAVRRNVIHSLIETHGLQGPHQTEGGAE